MIKRYSDVASLYTKNILYTYSTLYDKIVLGEDERGSVGMQD